MNILGIPDLVAVPWMVFAAYRIASTLTVGRRQKKELPLPRLAFLLVQVLAFTLMFVKRVRIGFLGKPFAPELGEFRDAGILLTWLGIGLALWARHHLGQYWSARIGVKQDHKLVRSGPYASVRHPIYSGILLALIGTALVVGEWGCVVSVCLMLLGFSSKARREDALLAEQFGEAYPDYRRHAGFMIPRFR